MIAFVFTLAAALPQAPAADPDVVVATGYPAAWPVEVLDLGDGGISAERRMVAQPRADVGAWSSPGGVLVRVSDVGVKLDFPSGAELLVDRGCRVHTRAGTATLPITFGFDLVLADGARIAIRPASSDGRRPLQSVVAEHGEAAVALWRTGRDVRHARGSLAPRDSGYVLHALGDGSVLYRVQERGPLVDCERVLCVPEHTSEFPRRRVVVLGDPLVASLRELPRTMPRKSSEYPEGPQAAVLLAQIAEALFRPGIQRPPAGAIGASTVVLAGELRLELVDRPHGVLALTLTAPHAALPVCEWLIGHTTTLHLVRKDAGQGGKPRYFQRGVPVVTR